MGYIQLGGYRLLAQSQRGEQSKNSHYCHCRQYQVQNGLRERIDTTGACDRRRQQDLQQAATIRFFNTVSRHTMEENDGEENNDDVNKC